MRSLNKYIEECGEMAAPANTMGMGDVQLPDDVNPGVDGVPHKKKKIRLLYVWQTMVPEFRKTEKNLYLRCFTAGPKASRTAGEA